MPERHAFHRRALLGAGLAAAPLLTAAAAQAATTPQPAKVASAATGGPTVSAAAFGLAPSPDRDQTAALQAAIDQTAAKGLALMLPPGTFIVGGLALRPGTRLTGAPGATVLRNSGVGVGIYAERAHGLRLEHLVIDGGDMLLDRARTEALLQITDSRDVTLHGLHVTGSSANCIHLARSSGGISDVRVDGARDAGIWSLDADTVSGGLVIARTTVTDCRDNGILVWRSGKGDDGTRICDVTIQRIGNRSGGSGQFGNGINVFRADNVSVANARITDCAYSAIRGNAAGNIQMTANHIARIGEVALYAEFGFEGAMISNNIIDGAATGISIANFNEGGRLAVVQGNLIRNLTRREHEATDKRGEGIAVEADASITGNVIEGAPTAGILIGWGRYMRDVVATGNLIRASRIGIAVSGDAAAGHCLLANNMISGASGGAIRAMDHARPTGTDLAVNGTAPKHITLMGNVAA